MGYVMVMENDPYHYALIARAIGFIEANAPDQPALEDIAASVGLSPAHFQRVFSSWVGISPKKYQQYLTLDLAKGLLKNRFTVLDTAHEAGLSGAGRLHDLFINWEAMSPGDYAKAGGGLDISYGWFASPFGLMLVAGTGRGICGIAFAGQSGRDAAQDDLFGRWPKAAFNHNPDALRDWVNAALTGKGEAKLLMIGSPLQIKVWEALLHIPDGQVSTYSEIARVIDRPKAVRAVGTAVGRNPVSWLIPCHRALRKSGALGGYHWGLPVKRALLAFEAARFDANQ